MRKISEKLVKRVFITYFLIALTITAGHMITQYFDEKGRVSDALFAYKETVISSLAKGLWNFDPGVIEPTLKGLLKAPMIQRASATAIDAKKPLVDVSIKGALEENLSLYTFPITYEISGKKEKVGSATFYYANDLILMNTLEQAILILSLSLIKTLILWLIITHWAKKIIEKPLQLMTDMSNKAFVDGEDFKYKAQIHSGDEIETMEQSFISLMGRMSHLERESQAKSSFLSNMSHELRTPLNAVIGYSEIIEEACQEEDSLDAKEILPDAKRIRQSGIHLLSLVNSLLDISKIESGKMTFLNQNIEIKSLVKEIQVLVKPLMTKQNNTFEIKETCQNNAFHQDESRVRQILINLLSNAAKYTANGKVTLKLENSEQKGKRGITFTVEDTGIGIAKENHEKVFKKFEQVHDTSKDSLAGSGLGLSLVEKLLGHMEGSIKLESELGVGSRFIVFIPSAFQQKSKKSNGLRALVIEDDEDIRDYLVGAISAAYICDHTSNAAEAKTKFAVQPYDILITDMYLPGESGADFIGSLHKEGKLPGCVILITGSSLGSDVLAKKKLPITGFLQKPFSEGELLKAVEKATTKQKAS